MNYKEIAFYTGASMLGGILTAVFIEVVLKPALAKHREKQAAKKAAKEAKTA